MGSIMITPFPGAVKIKPGSATVPFFGIKPVILDPQSGKVLEGNNIGGILCVKNPWPSIARTVWKDNNRYLDTYMRVCIYRRCGTQFLIFVRLAIPWIFLYWKWCCL